MKFVYRKSWNYGYLALDLGRPDPKKCLNYGHPGRHDFSGASFQEILKMDTDLARPGSGDEFKLLYSSRILIKSIKLHVFTKMSQSNRLRFAPACSQKLVSICCFCP
jgi:hypothetical protein